MNFSDALILLKQGAKMRRQLWTRRTHMSGLYVELVHLVSANDGRSVPPMLMVTAADDMLRPFTGASWDLLADDWEVAE